MKKDVSWLGIKLKIFVALRTSCSYQHMNLMSGKHVYKTPAQINKLTLLRMIKKFNDYLKKYMIRG